MRAKISGQEVRSGLDWSVGFGWASTDNPQRSPTEVSVGVKEMYMYVLDRAEDRCDAEAGKRSVGDKHPFGLDIPGWSDGRLGENG